MSGINLVTGASGFIGTYLVQQLLARGESVRVFVRKPQLLDPAVRCRVDVVTGDIRKAQDIAAAVRGADSVFHLAACAKAWCRDRDEFDAVNVRAVGSLLEAAAAHGVSRLVHVSTIVTLPPHPPQRLYARTVQVTPYERSKCAGERLVEKYAAAGHHAVIVHPTRVYGPGPLREVNGVTMVIAQYLRGRFRFRLSDEGVLSNYVHAEDVAQGIRLAAERGARGAHYVLGGENMNFRGFLDLVSEIAGVRRLSMAIPKSVALAMGFASEAVAPISGSSLVTAGWIRIFLEDRRADITATCNDLGYSPRSLRTGLEETIEWLGRTGKLAGWRRAA